MSLELVLDKSVLVGLALLELDHGLDGREAEYLDDVLAQAVLQLRAHQARRLVADHVHAAQLDALGDQTVALDDVHELLVLAFQVARELFMSN